MLHKPSQEDLEKWIWIAKPDPIPNSYIYARKTFVLDSAPTSALIKASADSRYKLFVNGRYVGKGPVRSAEGSCCVDSYDVTNLLTRGSNVVAFLVHHIGENTYAYSAGKPGLICRVKIETGGEPHVLGTDETWKVRRATEWTDSGARMSHRLGFQEVYDARNACEDWNQVRCGDKGWENAVVVGVPPALPWGEMITRQIPPLREERISPSAVIGVYNGAEVSRDTPAASMPAIMASTDLATLRSGGVNEAEALLSEAGQTHVRTPRGDKGVVVVLDFGREVFGNVEIGLAGAGGCIDIGYGELLLDGHVMPNRDDTRYTDRIYLNRGRLAWQSFEPRAFRYLQIEFRRCPRPVEIDHVRVNQTSYPVRQTGSFECSDKLVNQIWETGVYTAHLCMEDTFIDCPWRERGQWWGDARILSRSAYYAFDDTALLAQGLRQFASAQTQDGAIRGLYPPGDTAIATDFALLWVFSILDYYAFSDDAELVRELYPAVKKLIAWFAGCANDSGMLVNVPGRLLIDRADLERRGEVTSLNCFYHQALRIAGALASIAGYNEDAQDFLDTANRLKTAINKFMYVPRRGLYAECRIDGKLIEKFSRQTNILAALFDITDQYQKAGIFRQLGSGVLPELGSPYFASYYLEALYSADRHPEQALDYHPPQVGAGMVRGRRRPPCGRTSAPGYAGGAVPRVRRSAPRET
jgi:alpha-L-rhamnosidase